MKRAESGDGGGEGERELGGCTHRRRQIRFQAFNGLLFWQGAFYERFTSVLRAFLSAFLRALLRARGSRNALAGSVEIKV